MQTPEEQAKELIEFTCWLSRYYTQTELWRFWRNAENKVFSIEDITDHYINNVLGKTSVLNHYPQSHHQ